MTRIHPVNFRFTEPKNKRLLEQVRKDWGRLPNFFLTLANSPAALDGFLKFKEALEEGDLNLELQEKIALTVAAINDCRYSVGMHWDALKNLEMGEKELMLNLEGSSLREKDKVILGFVKKIIQNRGQIDDEEFKSIKKAGLYNGQIIQILAEVCLNMFANYFVQLSQLEMDYSEMPQESRPV